MKNRLIILVALILSTISCTKQEVIYTGTYNGVFDMSMMDYLRTDDYNWKFTVEAIEHAGLTEMFEKDSITFFGIKSHSIERYIIFNDKKKITDFPVDEIKGLLLKYVHIGIVPKESIRFRNKNFLISDPEQDGGTEIGFIPGNKLLVYLEKTPYGGVPDAGAIKMQSYSNEVGSAIVISTPNLITNNGIVHALDYNNTFGEI